MPLKVSDGIKKWIEDFVGSKDSKFEGDSEKKRRERAIAAYMDAKRGSKESVDEKMDSASLAKAVAAFKKKGGKIKKVAPGKAQGYHGKDDPGKDVAGNIDRGDTKRFGTRKKVRSIGASTQSEEMTFQVDVEGLPKMYIDGNSPSEVKMHLRKLFKQPSMVKKVKRITTANLRKTFRQKSQGKEADTEIDDVKKEEMKLDWGTTAGRDWAVKMTPGQKGKKD